MERQKENRARLKHDEAAGFGEDGRKGGGGARGKILRGRQQFVPSKLTLFLCSSPFFFPLSLPHSASDENRPDCTPEFHYLGTLTRLSI